MADCPDCDHPHGIAGCTCRPWTRQTEPPRYLDQPGDTVDMIGGWEPGLDCLHHRPALTTTFPESDFILPLPLEPTIGIQGPDGQPLVTLNTATGEMTFGPSYTPDAAAEAFWDAVDTMGLAPVRQDHAARAAKERAWALVGQWRAAASARGDDPYADPYAQALAAALTDSVPRPAADAGEG
ncbi:hypothetical protein [Streptomyces sp. NPDC015130]|uniref:hypothetical protein n=1 Tax=Streptomyces sp. NPDC015130 TaxID=3364940 RepID=UPI0036FB183D